MYCVKTCRRHGRVWWCWEWEELSEVVKHLLKEGGNAGEHAEFTLDSYDGLP